MITERIDAITAIDSKYRGAILPAPRWYFINAHMPDWKNILQSIGE